MPKSEVSIYIDDSGDPGFKKSPSRFFLMAGIVFEDADDMSAVVAAMDRYRKRMGWSDKTEFKFNKTKKGRIKHLLSILNRYHYSIFAVYVDKNKYNARPSNELYNYLIEKLLLFTGYNYHKVRIDGKYDKEYAKKTRSVLRRKAKNAGIFIKSLKMEDSTTDYLIQLADLVAGSILRFLKHNNTDWNDYIKIFKKHIVKLKELNIKME